MGLQFGQGLSFTRRRRVSSLAQAIKDEKIRAEKDGATIEDGVYTDLIDPVYDILKGAGVWSDVLVFAPAGVRKLASGNQSIIYDQSGNKYDLDQSTSSKRPTDDTQAAYGGHVVSNADGSDDVMTTGSVITVLQPYTVFAVGAISSGDALSSGDSSTGAEIVHSSSWQIYAGSTVTGGTPDNNPHTVSGVFDGASSFLEVDGSQVLSGDPGTGEPSNFLIHNNPGGTRPNGEEGALWIYINTKLGSTVRDDLRSASQDYFGV